MAVMEDPNTEWFNGPDDDLIRELLDNESPFFVSPHIFDSDETLSAEPVANHPVSRLTNEEAESESSIASGSNESNENTNIFQARIAFLEEKVMSKIDNKYTLKIKCCGNEMSDDGYKWRKYGQKSIKNSPHPRSYYRCTNPRCSAKKQVERSSQDPDTLVVTYEGLHLHFTYTHFLLDQPQPSLTYPPNKKLKMTNNETQTQQIHETAEQTPSKKIQGTEEAHSQEIAAMFNPIPPTTAMLAHQQELWEEESQGLLEDMVPLMIRRPSNTTTMSNTSSCTSSYPSSPPTSSSSSLTWPPNISSVHGNGLTSSTM